MASADAGTWTAEQVGEWLSKIDGVTAEIVDEFVENDIDGDALLSLDQRDLKEDLGGTVLCIHVVRVLLGIYGAGRAA